VEPSPSKFEYEVIDFDDYIFKENEIVPVEKYLNIFWAKPKTQTKLLYTFFKHKFQMNN